MKNRSLPSPGPRHFRRAPPESEHYLIPLEEPLRPSAILEEPILDESVRTVSPEPVHLYEEIPENQSENNSINIMVESV